jgi:N-acetylglutamate synthase-like GNAT family acetyltransferase
VASSKEARSIVARLKVVGLMWEDVDINRSTFLLAPADSGINGFVGVELAGTSALLRSLYVEPARRRRSLGATLVNEAESFARGRGATRMFLFSTGAGDFFRRLGYTKIPVSSTVAALRTAPQVEWYTTHPEELAAEVTFVRTL